MDFFSTLTNHHDVSFKVQTTLKATIQTTLKATISKLKILKVKCSINMKEFEKKTNLLSRRLDSHFIFHTIPQPKQVNLPILYA